MNDQDKKIYELLKEYVDSYKKQYELDSNLRKALEAFDRDNTFYGTQCYEMSHATELLLKYILGEYNFEWLMWWQWDTDYGTRNQMVNIDNVEYNIDTLEKLIEFCFTEIKND